MSLPSIYPGVLPGAQLAQNRWGTLSPDCNDAGERLLRTHTYLDSLARLHLLLFAFSS